MNMPDADSPACSCGNDSGTVEHFLLFALSTINKES